MANQKNSKRAQSLQKQMFEDLGYKAVVPQKKAFVREISPIDYSLLGIVNETDKSWSIYIHSGNHAVKRIFMEEKKIAQIVLNHYDSVLQRIILPEFIIDIERTKTYLKSQCCLRGICYYSRVRVGVAIHDFDFVKNNTANSSVYWHKIPEHCFTTKEIIQSISYRVDKLTEILNNWDETDKIEN